MTDEPTELRPDPTNPGATLEEPMDEKSELLPCPFCGGGDTLLDEKRLSPTMAGPGALISATVTHWCEREGRPFDHRSIIQFSGRDRESAIANWNSRATVTP